MRFSDCRCGNSIFEVKYEDLKFSITRETIIENDMRIFREIERATYWNEYMFFCGVCYIVASFYLYILINLILKQ